MGLAWFSDSQRAFRWRLVMVMGRYSSLAENHKNRSTVASTENHKKQETLALTKNHNNKTYKYKPLVTCLRGYKVKD